MASSKHSKKGGGHRQGGAGGMLLMAGLAAALAAGAGYYATHKEEVDREAKKRIDQLAKAFKESKPQVERRVREVWGVVSEEAVALYMDARAGLLHGLEEESLKKTGRMLKKEYLTLVARAVREAKKSGLLDKNIEKKLEKLFAMDWKDVEKILQSGAMMAQDMAKKGVNLAAKEVAKRTGGGAKKGSSGSGSGSGSGSARSAKKSSGSRKSSPKKAAPKKGAMKKKTSAKRKRA